MDKSLVIVESSTKAKTINKYLGNNYIVKSSIGHVRDLAKNIFYQIKQNKKLIKIDNIIFNDEYKNIINKIGVDPFNGWIANYEILPKKEKIITELKILASNTKHIYLATDLDREGEAIAWHLQEVIGGDKTKFSRVIFNEITKDAIKKAFDNPTTLNIDRVNAQQTRRFLDRIVGYMLSPLLWKKISRGLSAGRVQSVAVRLIVERERQIKSFVPKKFWQLHVELISTDMQSIRMKVIHKNNKIFKPKTKTEIDTAINLLNNTNYKIIDLNEHIKTSKANPPFITSTLQKASSSQLGFGIKKTMLLAQSLYEAGYITYIRTDSTSLSQDALHMVRNYIKDKFGQKYLPQKANIYYNQNSSQEAHEAIRPSNIHITSENLDDIKISDAKKLYRLIWERFVASQMSDVHLNSIILTVQAKDFILKTQWRSIQFDGWSKIIPLLINNDNKKKLSISTLKINSTLKLKTLIPTKHFTQSPSRYTEATLVQDLEKKGIGRPSTYPIIISNITERGYVKIKKHKIYAEKIGEIVTDRLQENFSELMDYNFTAQLENRLDLIAKKLIKWKIVLNDFFIPFIKKVKNAHNPPEDGGMKLNKMVLTSIQCPQCSRTMGIKTASTGVFLSCTGYNLSKTISCKTTLNCIPENELLNYSNKNNVDNKTIINQFCLNLKRCYKCNIIMDTYLIDNHYKIYICGNNPICDGYQIEKGNFYKNYNQLNIKCDKCDKNMNFKIGKFGKYMKCVNQKCKNTRTILKNGEIAPPKEQPIPLPELMCKKSNTYFVLRNGSSGIFLAANTFPKSKETRAPYVEELVRVKDRIPIKLNYLTTAPTIDNNGNKTIIAFNYKTKEQYIFSEQNGKITNWQAFYINGKWIEKINKS